jgi:hypothetical protein
LIGRSLLIPYNIGLWQFISDKWEWRTVTNNSRDIFHDQAAKIDSTLPSIWDVSPSIWDVNTSQWDWESNPRIWKRAGYDRLSENSLNGDYWNDRALYYCFTTNYSRHCMKWSNMGRGKALNCIVILRMGCRDLSECWQREIHLSELLDFTLSNDNSFISWEKAKIKPFLVYEENVKESRKCFPELQSNDWSPKQKFAALQSSWQVLMRSPRMPCFSKCQFVFMGNDHRSVL